MIEIKFRAWHKTKRQMIIGSFEYWLKACAESGKGSSIYDACEWMQFTGIKDKNGKEIYEGDIIDNSDYISDAHCCNPLGKSVIEWDNNLPGWGGFIGEIVEVIGNIYENPELYK